MVIDGVLTCSGIRELEVDGLRRVRTVGAEAHRTGTGGIRYQRISVRHNAGPARLRTPGLGRYRTPGALFG